MSNSKIVNRIVKRFTDIYGNKEGVRVFFAPGRVNLIGEHTDYNGGYSLPIAIDRGSYIVCRKRDDNKVNLYPHNGDIKKSINLDKIEYLVNDKWISYIKGVIKELQDEKYKLSGLDVFQFGNIPIGCGLSSSAALEVVCAYTFISMTGKRKIDHVKIAQLSQKAENDFVGVKCGIMDQFASSMGKEKNAVLLNSDTLEYEYIPFDTGDYSLVVANTNVERELVTSDYNTRREECESALSKIKAKKKKINTLSDLKVKDIDIIKPLLNRVEFKRVKYVIEENKRVLNAVKALKSDNIIKFGKYLNESHEGLKKLYEVSCRELNILVEDSLAVGAVGARMIGGGFGGCIIALVHKDDIEKYIETIYTKYKEKTGLEVDVYVVKPSDSVREIKQS